MAEHHHDHNHDDDHQDHDLAAAGIGTGDYVPGYFEMLEMSIGELLVERGLIGASEIRRQIEVLDSRTPALGAKVVARAWVDPEFKKRLLSNGRAACEELGISFYDDTGLIVLENTDDVHNLIVCTLCSCYPWPTLGLPPYWYKDPTFRARAAREPRAVLKEFGLDLAPETEIKVWDSSAQIRWWVLPERPGGTEGMSEPELAELVTPEAMMGVAKVDPAPASKGYDAKAQGF